MSKGWIFPKTAIDRLKNKHSVEAYWKTGKILFDQEFFISCFWMRLCASDVCHNVGNVPILTLTIYPTASQFANGKKFKGNFEKSTKSTEAQRPVPGRSQFPKLLPAFLWIRDALGCFSSARGEQVGCAARNQIRRWTHENILTITCLDS